MVKLLFLAGILLCSAATAAVAVDEDLIYRPQPAAGAIPESPEQGVLVRTITIKKGDTLSKLSRRYEGKGYYFPQILLFNNIENPNLIYAGKTLRVPVRRAALAEPPPASSGKETRREAAPTPAQPPAQTAKPAAKPATGDDTFKQGMSEFRSGRYRVALGLFDQYLHAFPDAVHSADATYYRGECYLKLSREQ